MELTWKQALCKPAGVEWMLPWMPLLLLMITGPVDAGQLTVEFVGVMLLAAALYRDARRRPRRPVASIVAEGAIWSTAFLISVLLLPSGPFDWAIFALALVLWVGVVSSGRPHVEAAS
ncbi:MAG TPA: hypothetical protein VKU40_03575 [Thermoanaerobaculia bacterium]|nr:hypothetical protein [Thermoanaerobaculia bacterium]